MTHIQEHHRPVFEVVLDLVAPDPQNFEFKLYFSHYDDHAHSYEERIHCIQHIVLPVVLGKGLLLQNVQQQLRISNVEMLQELLNDVKLYLEEPVRLFERLNHIKDALLVPQGHELLVGY